MDGYAARPTQSSEVDGDTAARIRQLKRIVERELPKAVEKLGDQRATPVVRHLFPSEPGPSDAKEAHIERWRLISSAAFDGDCHSDRRRFDKEQARAELELRRRIGGDALIAEHLIKAIVLELWPRGVFRHGAADADRRGRTPRAPVHRHVRTPPTRSPAPAHRRTTEIREGACFIRRLRGYQPLKAPGQDHVRWFCRRRRRDRPTKARPLAYLPGERARAQPHAQNQTRRRAAQERCA